MCGICGGDVHVTGDGDLVCMGHCGETLTREEIDESFDAMPPSHPLREVDIIPCDNCGSMLSECTCGFYD